MANVVLRPNPSIDSPWWKPYKSQTWTSCERLFLYRFILGKWPKIWSAQETGFFPQSLLMKTHLLQLNLVSVSSSFFLVSVQLQFQFQFQFSFISVSILFQFNFNSIQFSYISVSIQFHFSFNSVSVQFQFSFNSVSDQFQFSFNSVSIQFQFSFSFPIDNLTLLLLLKYNDMLVYGRV